MHIPRPIFASESLAAKMLDMKRTEFQRLVASGNQPPPRDIGGLKRWDIDKLKRIISGDLVDGMAGVEWYKGIFGGTQADAGMCA